MNLMLIILVITLRHSFCSPSTLVKKLNYSTLVLLVLLVLKLIVPLETKKLNEQAHDFAPRR